MLGRFGSKTPDNSRHAPMARPASAPVPEVPAPAAAAPLPDAKPEDAKPQVVSCIGPDMSITGNIVCDAPMQVFGRIEGELRATEVEIGDSAEVEGNVMAEDLTIRGHVKGTVRAIRVKLQGNGTVEGDIFHRSLSIDEHALFEGNSRRVENPIEPQTRAAATPLRGVIRPNLQALGDILPDTSAA